jgi:hypothetical protein
MEEYLGCGSVNLKIPNAVHTLKNDQVILIEGLQCQPLGRDRSQHTIRCFCNYTNKKTYVSMGTVKYITLILDFYLSVTELALHYYIGHNS